MSSEAENRLLERVIELLHVSSEEIFLADTMDKVRVKKPDSTYSQKPLVPGQEFLFDSVYIGKRGKPIFCFKPFDKQVYQTIELDVKDIDTVLPGFTPVVANGLGEHFGIHEDMATLLEMLAQNLVAQDAKDAEAEQLANELAFADNPNFGLF